jgi:hypothetical protein
VKEIALCGQLIECRGMRIRGVWGGIWSSLEGPTCI